MRNPKKVIYASSADRGLNVLLELWPEVKKQVPDAELVWAYGWNSYDAMHKDDPSQMKWKYEVIRQMHKVGCKALGRLSHEDLAKEMQTCGVWAYPTAFPEINCITAIKCGKAGCIPITSGYAALQETVLEPQKDWQQRAYDGDDKEFREDFVQRLVAALKEGRSEEERKQWSDKYDAFDWSHIAQSWSNALS